MIPKPPLETSPASPTPEDGDLTEGTPEPEVEGAEHEGGDIPASLESIVAPLPTYVDQQRTIAAAKVGFRVVTFGVFLILFVVLGVLALRQITHVMELFVIGLLIAMAINPMVAWLERKGVRRAISVGVLVLLLAGGFAAAVTALAPTLVDQSANLVRDFPQYSSRMQGYADQIQHRFPSLDVSQLTARVQAAIEENLSAIQAQATTLLTTSVTWVFESVLVVFIIVFFLVDPQPLIRGLRGLMPDEWQPEVQRIGELAVGKVNAWIQGTLLLMLSIFVASTVGLYALGVPYALLWGVLAGLFEAIPTIGPILSSIPPILVALTISPTKAVWVLGLFLVVQQLESNILVPIVMANKVRLHPVTLLFFLLMMAQFLGIFGALIATPLAAVIKVLYMELYYHRIHGTLPDEEADDPVRMKILERFAKKTNLDNPPGPPAPARSHPEE
jgi:predicted PurR-regulated permease PerM